MISIEIVELGSKISRLKPRIYRFSRSILRHICIETLEKIFLETSNLPNQAIIYINDLLDSFRMRGVFESSVSDHEIAKICGIEFDYEIKKRRYLACQDIYSSGKNENFEHVLITGSPRSGTSHLFNLISSQGKYAYFTADSHAFWGMTPFKGEKRYWHHSVAQEPHLFMMDSRHLKLDPSLLIPNEGEAIFHQYMPVYKHLKGHTYRLYPDGAESTSQSKADPEELLEQKDFILSSQDVLPLIGIMKLHMQEMGRDCFLSKSPFCSFRLQKMLENDLSLKVIHIYRDEEKVCNSLKRNGFTFTCGGDADFLSHKKARNLFVDATNSATKNLQPDRYAEISYEKLLLDPNKELARLNEQLRLNFSINKLMLPPQTYK